MFTEVRGQRLTEKGVGKFFGKMEMYRRKHDDLPPHPKPHQDSQRRGLNTRHQAAGK